MTLPRFQLFEFNDHPGVPEALRDTVVEALGRTLEWGRILRGLAGPFRRFVEEAGVSSILDIGSGSGDPARILVREMNAGGFKPPKIILSDLYPRIGRWDSARRETDGIIDFIPNPVDATEIPEGLVEGRAVTIINVFHHFPPHLAQEILTEAVKKSRGVFIAEAFERKPIHHLNLALAGIPALAAGPLLSRSNRMKKAFWTWLTPASYCVSVWDAIVSTLRVYSRDELLAMSEKAGEGWRWEYGTFSYPPAGRGYFFKGIPVGRIAGSRTARTKRGSE